MCKPDLSLTYIYISSIYFFCHWLLCLRLGFIPFASRLAPRINIFRYTGRSITFIGSSIISLFHFIQFLLWQWIASTSCSTSSCNPAEGHLYDPSEAAATGANFTIQYFSGSAAGPIVWDSVTIEGYTIDNRALEFVGDRLINLLYTAAVYDVQSEPLAPNFTGVLGKGLPLDSLDSIIAADGPPAKSNSQDGAAWASNLFSINSAPSFHFLSLALSRPRLY